MNEDIRYTKGTRHEIYIGLNDKDSYKELLTEKDFVRILSEICTDKQICFTLLNQFGGYTHNKGYVTETSFRIVIIGAKEEEILALAERLKKEVNTDTVLISRAELDYCFM